MRRPARSKEKNNPAIRKRIHHAGARPARRVMNMITNLPLRRAWRTSLIARYAMLPMLLAPGLAFAQVSATLDGAPVQVTPFVPELGVPTIEIPQGTVNTTSTGSGPGTGSGSSGASGSDALDTMLAQSWGNAAIANAEALGVNPSALAATCVIESGCGANVGSGSGAQGPFQMYPAAFQEGLQTALAADPSLASEIVQGSAGMNDPTTEAIAASGYLMQANQTLQNMGVSNPTVLDARSYYEFGPTYGSEIASSIGTTPLSSIVPPSYLANNGISPTETISQWQSSVAAQIGNTANQTVLG